MVSLTRNNGTTFRYSDKLLKLRQYGSDVEPTKREAGIDWLTMTMPHDYGILASHWANTIMSELGNEPGMLRKQANVQGYAGSQVGKLFVGEHQKQGWIAQASSGLAHELIAHYDSSKCNCSRIDTQFTVWLPEPMSARYWQKLPKRVARASSKRRGKPTSYHEYLDSKGGRTFYIGSNSSDVQCKIYDKYAEQKQSSDWKYAYRFEVRWRGDYAKRTAIQLRQETTGIRHLEAARITGSRFARYGILLPDESLEGITVDCTIPKQEADIARKLRWLETQVRPTVSELLKTIAIEEVLQVLGVTMERYSDNDSPVLVSDGSTIRKWSH